MNAASVPLVMCMVETLLYRVLDGSCDHFNEICEMESS